ncbi:MAG: rod shape-determining protein MreC, partial [Lachnospiraceae bacterium]|nr:rod shape-determining protein MreC [Candidatus Equihabitans merdae]
MKRRHRQLKSRHWLVIMVIVCVGLIVTSLSTHLVAAPIRAVAGYVITPFQNAVNDIGLYFVDQSHGFRSVKELAEENEALRAEIAELTEQNNLLIQDQDKLQRLEELYDLDQSYADLDKVAAEVISKDPGNWYTTFVINKGARDGIQVDMNVLGDGGLVGIVTETGDNWAQVRSIMDDESNVSVMISYNANTFTMNG